MFNLNSRKHSSPVERSNMASGYFHAAHPVRGFTLIELMIVVVIIGIIAAVAIPAYRGSIMKSNRSAAKAALLDLAGREEKYYSLANTYAPDANNANSLGVQLYGTGSTVTFPINVPATGKALYTISAPTVTAAVPATATTAGTPATFTINAVPVAGTIQANDQCGTFTINSAGQQTVSGSGSCW